MKTIRFLGFWICLVIGLALGTWSQRPPAPVAANAPATAFSADRAMADVRAIAQKPHPTGSTEIARVRDHLRERISELGLEVSIHAGEGSRPYSNDGRALGVAAVQNLVGVLPGNDPALPAILVMSHYDSVHNSPGAADDATGVAAALEIARALKADESAHARDVIFLFTDAEEPGLLGADAFFARDPMLQHVGLVVNMEARGDAGRAAMFQTGPGNGALMSLFARTAKGPSANSLASTVYEKMPNDTDFTHAVKRGLPGLNLAFIDDQLAYHTPLARPDHLERGSLQHIGDQVLPTVRALADATALPARTENAIYSDVLGLFLISYPPLVGWILLVVALGLIAFTAWRTLVGRGASGWEIARGAAGLLLIATSAALLLHMAGRMLMISDAQRYYGLLTRFDHLLWGAGAIAVAAGLGVATAQARGAGRIIPCVVALALGGACSLAGGFDPVGLGLGVATCVLAAVALGFRTGALGAWIGGMIVLLILATAAQVLAPGATVMLTWPLLIAAVGAALVIGVGGTRDKRVALALTFAVGALAVLSTAQLTAWGSWTFAGVGMMEPAILALFAMLAAPALSPLAHDFAATRWAWRAAGILAIAGAAVIANAARLDGEPGRPAITQALHVADLSTGKAWRVADQPRLDAWTKATLPDDGGSDPRQQALQPFWRNPVWMSETRVVPVEAPQLTVDRAEDRLLVRLTPAPGAEQVIIRLRPSAALSLPRLNGRPITFKTEAGKWSSLTYHAPDPNGVTLSFTTSGTGKVDVAALEYHDGWPAMAKTPPAKPANLMAFGMSDKTAVLVRAGMTW